MTRQICCTTSGAFGYWVAVFLVIYGTGLAAMTLWPELWAFDETVLLASLGIACLVNFGKNQSFHCILTGPLFLAGALTIGLGEAGLVSVEPGLIWGAILVGVGTAALLEARFAPRPREE